jgi:hypothetical protein
MFRFLKKAVELPYESVGHIYADRVPLLIDVMVHHSPDWTGKPCKPEVMGRELAILALTIFQLFLGLHIEEETGRERVLAGFLARIDERYANFTGDAATAEIFREYLKAGTADLSTKDKKESFPTLVALAIKRIAGLDDSDEYWPPASTTIYDFVETIMKGSVDAIAEAKKRFKLV